MKRLHLGILIALLFAQAALLAQAPTPESTGYDGDNFSLEGALALLKTADSPEDFEKKLNQKDNDVNNLDLNQDGEIDYIRIEDNQGDGAHAFVLQVAIGEDDVQDIAVIEIEKTGTDEAILQIIGDEDVFGEQKIVEPYEESETTQGHKGGFGEFSERGIFVNVWFWPSIRFVYAPAYRPWVSPWRYRVYPRWYRPYKPRPYYVFAPLTVRYRVHYRPTTIHRVTRAHRVYQPRRRSSVVVHKRTTTVRATKSTKMVKGKKTTKTTTVGKKGNKVGMKQTQSTTKAAKKGNKAGVKHTKTTTKAAKKGNKAGVKHTKTTTKAGKKGNKARVTKTKKTTVKRRRN